MKLAWKFCLLILILMLFSKAALPQDSLNVRCLSNLSIGASTLAIQGHYAYVSALDDGLWIIDIADPTNPAVTGHIPVPDHVDDEPPGNYAYEDVAVGGNYVYLAAHQAGLRVVDISDPTAPVEVGYYVPQDAASYGAEVSGSYVYLVEHDGLRIISVANPAAPVEVAAWGGWAGGGSVIVRGQYAYVVGRNAGMWILDITDPAHPQEVSFYLPPTYPGPLAVSGDYAYLLNLNGLSILNISDPAAPVEAGFFGLVGPASGVAVSGNHVFIANAISGVVVLDVHNPAAPTEDGYYNTAGYAMDIVTRDSLAYVADEEYFGIYDWSAVDQPLPVEFLGLNATSGNESITLNWRTASERNTLRFEIVRDGLLAGYVESRGSGVGERAYSWVDCGLENGHGYRYELYCVSTDRERLELQRVEATASVISATAVTDYALHAAYPNPFNPSTTIEYDLVEPGDVQLMVYNLVGQRVAVLVQSVQGSGTHTAVFDAAKLPAGTYFYQLEANRFHASGKMLLLK